MDMIDNENYDWVGGSNDNDKTDHIEARSAVEALPSAKACLV